MKKWSRPEGLAPKVRVTSIGRTGLVDLKFNKPLIFRKYLPSSEDLKFTFLPYDGNPIEGQE